MLLTNKFYTLLQTEAKHLSSLYFDNKPVAQQKKQWSKPKAGLAPLPGYDECIKGFPGFAQADALSSAFSARIAGRRSSTRYSLAPPLFSTQQKCRFC